MKKSIIILGAIFLIAIVAWIDSPSLFVGEQGSTTRSRRHSSAPVKTSRVIDYDDDSRTDSKKEQSASEVSKEINKNAKKPAATLKEKTTVLGSFRSPDSSYQSRGQLVLKTKGSQKTLHFENFSVSKGPDLFVTLNKKSNPNSGSLGSHRKLRRLKSTSGTQSYDVSDIDLSDYQSLAIYCDSFSKVFGVAQL